MIRFWQREGRTWRWLTIIVLVVVLGGVATFWLRPPRVGPRLVFLGGPILTMSQPATVEALYVQDGIIRALGNKKDVLAAAGDDVEIIHLRQATLMPGIIEVHTHPIASALVRQSVDVSGFTHHSRNEVMKTLKEAADSFSPNGWVIATGWDPMMVEDLDSPTIDELDALSPDRPLLILTQMMHEAFGNRAAFEAAGITDETPNPRGAEFVRDSNGQLTGQIREVNAIKKMFNAVPAIPAGAPELLTNLELTRYSENGITTLGVLGPIGRIPDPIGTLRSLGSAPDAKVRLIVYALPPQLKATDKPHKVGRFELRGVKYWMDGSPFAGGAAWREPYENTSLVRERLHLKPGFMAELNYSASDFMRAFSEMHRRGFQVAVHTQGERAIDRVLETAAAVLEEYPRANHRHRLEHNALITEAQLVQARELGMTVSFFVDHLYFYGKQLPLLIGNERLQRYMPLRTAVTSGHRVTIHTDSPSSPLNMWRAIRTAILRTPHNAEKSISPEQGITIEEALYALTRNAAWQLGMENEIGTLEVGKRADLVILSENPLSMDVQRLPDIKVHSTWLDGQPVETRTLSMANLRLVWNGLISFF